MIDYIQDCLDDADGKLKCYVYFASDSSEQPNAIEALGVLMAVGEQGVVFQREGGQPIAYPWHVIWSVGPLTHPVPQ